MKTDPGAQRLARLDAAERLPARTDPDDAASRRAASSRPSIFGAGLEGGQPDTMFPLFAQPSIGDLDQDGVPDVVTRRRLAQLASGLLGGGSRATGPAQHLLAVWSGKTGKMLPGSPDRARGLHVPHEPGDRRPRAATTTPR